jgi:hypothetical protein
MSKRKGNAGSSRNRVRGSVPLARVGRSFAARRKALVDKAKAGPDVGAFLGRSGLEDRLGAFLREHDVGFKYEPERIRYVVPEKVGQYTPDFKIENVFLETKGRFTSEDRKKMLAVFRSNPDLNLLMVFPKPSNTITKRSKTTYGIWCDKNNIPWISLDDLEKLIKNNKENYVDLLLKRTKGLGYKPNNRRRTKTIAGCGDAVSTSALGGVHAKASTRARTKRVGVG